MPVRPRRFGVPSLFTALLSIALVACSTVGNPSASLSAPPTSTPAPTSSPTVAATPVAAFPVTVTDDEGTAVDLPAEPQKIVSMTPATTEILFELGAGDRIMATDDGSDYPDAAKALPHVATFDKVDVEKVVALEPDLVIAGGLGFTPADSIAKLRSLKVPVVVLYAGSVDGVFKDIELLGSATGTTEEAATLTQAMRIDMDMVHLAVDSRTPKPRVYYGVGYDDTTGAIYAPADDSFVAEMVTLAGADAITTGDPASYQIPLETLIQRDPQIIVLGTNPYYNPTPESVLRRTGWGAMTAVKTKDVRPVNDIEITRPGPRLPTGLRSLAAAIWPDVNLPPPPA
jgi:iron complex transport system substrate-binding protein